MFDKLRKWSCGSVYNIGFLEKETGLPDVSWDRIHWLKHDYQSKGWFADPFILDYDSEKVVLLVEEKNYKLDRGIICELTVDRKSYQLLERCPLLVLDSHLSFPNILREGDKTYVCPENGKAGVFSLYELNNHDNKLDFVKTLVNAKLSDATIYKNEKGYFILATLQPNDNADDLVIYHSSSLFGEFEEYKHVKFPDNSARNAGAILFVGDKKYKISQDCNGGYGVGLKVYEMDDDFNFTFINEFHPEGRYDGLHTYNRYRNLAVVDNRRVRRRLANHIYMSMSRLKVKVFGK